MELRIDYLPAKCGIEVERGMVRAFSEVDPDNRIESKWMDLPEDMVIRWAEIRW